MDLAAYTERHRHFLTGDLPPLLERSARASRPSALADLGAGDGAAVAALRAKGLLGDRVYAIDLAPERVARCETLGPEVVGVVADATRTPLPDACVDAVIAMQVIEHLPNDRALAAEIARLLRPGGWFYVSSVLRGPHAWWFYRVDGGWALDPTHVREYETVQQFADALAHPTLRLDVVHTEALTFPLPDLALRLLGRVRLLPLDSLSSAYAKRPRLARLRSKRLRIPGYRLIAGAGTRAEA